MSEKDHQERADLSELTPVELRAIARDLGIEGYDRMTGRIALAAILAYEEKGVSMQSRYEVYQDAAGEWRWKHVADNGRLIADSGEGYDSKFNAERAKDRAMELSAEEWQHEEHA